MKTLKYDESKLLQKYGDAKVGYIQTGLPIYLNEMKRIEIIFDFIKETEKINKLKLN